MRYTIYCSPKSYRKNYPEILIDHRNEKFFVLCMAQQISRNAIPGLRGNPFDIRIESGFLESLVSNADSAKTPQGPRIINMKSQLFIGETVKAHNHRRTKNLVGAHSLRPCLTFYNFSFIEILKNMFTNGRSIINEEADDFQLHFLRVA